METRILAWENLSNSVKNDITENVYDYNKYVEKNYWNPNALKDAIDDLIKNYQPKFKIQYRNTNELYDELKRMRWGISEKNVEYLISLLRNGMKLDPIILNGDKFFDGGHRLTAYKRLNVEHSLSESHNTVEHRSKGRVYVNNRYVGKTGYRLIIKDIVDMDSSDSYYSWHTWSYARSIVNYLVEIGKIDKKFKL